MLTPPHVCRVSDIPAAAKTITSIMIKANPLTQFVYDKHRPPLLLPQGKLELFTVYLYQNLTNGLILSIDDDDEKCIGVAVWTGPLKPRNFLGRVRTWCILSILYVWLVLNSLYYGSEMNETVIKFWITFDG